MTKFYFKSKDGQRMIITSNDPILKMDFPDTNNRTVDITEAWFLESITAQEEPKEAHIPAN